MTEEPSKEPSEETKEQMSLKEFNRLPLEDRAKRLIQDYIAGRTLNADEWSLAGFLPVHEALDYIEDQGYMELVGGTPKSGAAYKVTPKGYEFIGK